MVIKNLFLLNNEEYFINSILKELCKKNIPYTYIKETNELHFDKYIIRFFTTSIINKSNTIEYNNLLFSIFEITNNIDNNQYLINEDIQLFDFDELKKQERYRINLDLQNQNAKMRIKNSNSKNLKILKKQLNPTRKIYR